MNGGMDPFTVSRFQRHGVTFTSPEEERVWGLPANQTS